MSRPGRSLPPGKIRYPLYRRLGGPQGRSGQVRKISPPPGFDLRNVQPVASRYTDYATRPAVCCFQQLQIFIDTSSGCRWKNGLQIYRVKLKAIPLQVWSGHKGCRTMRLPDFKDNRHMKVASLSDLNPGRLFLPGDIPGTHFC